MAKSRFILASIVIITLSIASCKTTKTISEENQNQLSYVNEMHNIVFTKYPRQKSSIPTKRGISIKKGKSSYWDSSSGFYLLQPFELISKKVRNTLFKENLLPDAGITRLEFFNEFRFVLFTAHDLAHHLEHEFDLNLSSNYWRREAQVNAIAITLLKEFDLFRIDPNVYFNYLEKIHQVLIEELSDKTRESIHKDSAFLYSNPLKNWYFHSASTLQGLQIAGDKNLDQLLEEYQ